MDLNDLAKIIFYQAIVDTYFKQLDLHTSITFDDFADNICDDEIIIKKILHELKGLYKYNPNFDNPWQFDFKAYDEHQSIIERYDRIIENDFPNIGEYDCFDQKSFKEISTMCKGTLESLLSHDIKNVLIKRTTQILPNLQRIRIDNLDYLCNKYVFLKSIKPKFEIANFYSIIEGYLKAKGIKIFKFQNENHNEFLDSVFYIISLNDLSVVNKLSFDFFSITVNHNLTSYVRQYQNKKNSFESSEVSSKLDKFIYSKLKSHLASHASEMNYPSVSDLDRLWKVSRGNSIFIDDYAQRIYGELENHCTSKEDLYNTLFHNEEPTNKIQYTLKQNKFRGLFRYCLDNKYLVGISEPSALVVWLDKHFDINYDATLKAMGNKSTSGKITYPDWG